MRGRADQRGRFRLDQRLEHRLERPADNVIDASVFQRLQQFEQGRLIQGHRVHLLREDFGRSRKDSHDGPLNNQSLAATYTTQRDVTSRLGR